MSFLTDFSTKKSITILTALVLAGVWPGVPGLQPPESRAAPATPAVEEKDLLAVLPVENLSGGQAPLAAITGTLKKKLTEQGIVLLGEDKLSDLMRRHRIRHTGGISLKTARAFKEEAGVEAVLLTSLEAYQESEPPQISLISRLVLSGDKPRILWMDSVGLSGDESPGLLDLNRIRDGELLLEQAAGSLTASLKKYLAGKAEVPSPAGRVTLRDNLNPEISVPVGGYDFKKKYRPKSFYRASDFDPDRPYKIAVVPFLNHSQRKDAGRIISLHMVRGLRRSPSLTVSEPGLVREQLLKYRQVMEEGPSLSDAELISSRSSLDADLIISGRVFDFQSITGTPEVDFSVHVIESENRRVVWESRSYNQGDEGVFFFDFGRKHTARDLTVEMTRAVLGLLLK
ncbi:MAG: hypothetical protein ACLFV2_06630 [Desulfurivibrionaceae bacterium]